MPVKFAAISETIVLLPPDGCEKARGERFLGHADALAQRNDIRMFRLVGLHALPFAQILLFVLREQGKPIEQHSLVEIIVDHPDPAALAAAALAATVDFAAT